MIIFFIIDYILYVHRYRVGYDFKSIEFENRYPKSNLRDFFLKDLFSVINMYIYIYNS